MAHHAASLLVLLGVVAMASSSSSLRAGDGGSRKHNADTRGIVEGEDANYVNFVGVTAVGFELDHYSITAGQSFDGVTASGPQTLDVSAGRQGSSGPAADFGAGLEILNVMGLDTAWPHLTTLPADLNFAIFGNLTLEFTDPTDNSTTAATCRDVRLGQGHTGFDNNWWLGDAECITVPDSGRLTCSILGCKPAVEFFAGDDDHSFQVRLTHPPARRQA
jgi:hypothetical protein